MTVRTSDFAAYYQPTACEKRVFLLAHGVEGDASPYLEVVRQLGDRHGSGHLARLGPYLDLSDGEPVARELRTMQAIRDGVRVLYRPRFAATVTLDGASHLLAGEPDYLIRDGDGYAIRNSKVARTITEEEHPEILREAETYGWLYERNTGVPPTRLEIHSGTGEIVAVPYDGGERALALLARIAEWEAAPDEPYRAVSFSNCSPCPYGERCLARAYAQRDLALLPGVDRELALRLHAAGIRTWEDLRSRFQVHELAEVRRAFGGHLRRVGRSADRILKAADAFSSGTPVWNAAPSIGAHRDWVMLDLEGFPPQLGVGATVFVWGMQVFGDHGAGYVAAAPGQGPGGDGDAWRAFLKEAAEILREHGDLPFVHWGGAEEVSLDAYVDRYGDPLGVACRVRANLFDLLEALRESVVLPLPSYSLASLERYVGFERSRSDDPLTRNREDLEAMWAVFRWLYARPTAQLV